MTDFQFAALVIALTVGPVAIVAIYFEYRWRFKFLNGAAEGEPDRVRRKTPQRRKAKPGEAKEAP